MTICIYETACLSTHIYERNTCKEYKHDGRKNSESMGILNTSIREKAEYLMEERGILLISLAPEFTLPPLIHSHMIPSL
jgi:hypothetical protein